MSKRVLILSYNALPMDVVSSYRAKAYCDYLAEYGYFPTLITHRWEKDSEGSWSYHDKNLEAIHEVFSSYEVYRLPRPIEKIVGNKLLTFISLLRGNLDSELIESYWVFKDFLWKHLQSRRYDLVLAIFSPHHHLKLAWEIQRTFNIPYILDFRDLWDNQIVTNFYNPSLKQKLFNKITKYYWCKWIKKALFFSTTSDVWNAYLTKLTGVEGVKVRNGMEIENFRKFEKLQPTTFNLTYFGRLYPYQSVDVILDGIVRFIKEIEPTDNVKVQLIGIKKVGGFNGTEKFLDKIPNSYLEIIESMTKVDLIEFCSQHTSIFLLPNLNEDNGSFFVKLYDYLLLNKPIVLAPVNNSENDLVVRDYGAGIVTSSSQEVANFLLKNYNLFKKGKSYQLADKDKTQLTRSYQVGLFTEKLNFYLDR